MKKLLKLSATALIIAGANMLLSQSALACSPNLPNYGNCVRMQQQQAEQHAYQMHQQQGYGNYGGYQEAEYNHSAYANGTVRAIKYLAILNDKQNKPYFYKTNYNLTYATPFPYANASTKAIEKCNGSNSRSPCQIFTSTTCIDDWDATGYEWAIEQGLLKTPEHQTCSKFKQILQNQCMVQYNNQKFCKSIKP